MPPRYTWIVLSAAWIASASAAAQAPAGLERRLERRASIAFQGQRLGPALERIGQTQDLPLWVDRRVDPTTTVDLRLVDTSLADVLAALLTEHELAARPLGDVVYVGPRRTADALPALAREARRSLANVPPARRREWLAPAAWSYPRLSEPRTLLGQLVEPLGATVDGASQIPHDLWPARTTSLAPVDAALVLLAGFDLTLQFEADGRRLKVVPIDYTQLAAAPPARPARTPRPARPAAGSSPDQAYTLKIEQTPVGAVVGQLAAQLKLDVTWNVGPPEAQAELADTRISCDVRQATLDELLAAVLGPAGLTFSRDGAAVTIERAP
jgi:hypothetical protein